MAGEPGGYEDAGSSASGAAYSVPWALGRCSPPSVLPAGWTAYFFPLSLLPPIYVFFVIQLVATSALQAACELLGFNLGYSKFASTAKWKSVQIPSRVGLLLFYLPAALIAALFLSAALGLSPALHLRATHMLPHSPAPLPAAVSSWMTAGAGAGKTGWEGQMGAWELVVAAVTSEQCRLVLVCAACLVHYSKRCLETLFLHRFSGTTCLATSVFIMLGYCMLAYVLLSSQWLTAAAATLPSRATTAAATAAAAAATVTAGASTAAAGASAVAPCSVTPTVNLMPLGLLLFLIGIAGNLYHHWLLTRLRSDGSHEYRVPHGGLFHWVTCPHYLFECIDFLGVALMSQTTLGSFPVSPLLPSNPHPHHPSIPPPSIPPPPIAPPSIRPSFHPVNPLSLLSPPGTEWQGECDWRRWQLRPEQALTPQDSSLTLQAFIASPLPLSFLSSNLGRRVVELGAGYGLAGMALAVQQQGVGGVLLTDGNDSVVARLSQTVEANRHQFGGTKVAVAALRWDCHPPPRHWPPALSPPFDAVIAADWCVAPSLTSCPPLFPCSISL
ncbi:unnamed protein product [Closterium sp. Yama58-4]|nr:unnamed protein product [Closterium sp. Yama58-4]